MFTSIMQSEKVDIEEHNKVIKEMAKKFNKKVFGDKMEEMKIDTTKQIIDFIEQQGLKEECLEYVDTDKRDEVKAYFER